MPLIFIPNVGLGFSCITFSLDGSTRISFQFTACLRREFFVWGTWHFNNFNFKLLKPIRLKTSRRCFMWRLRLSKKITAPSKWCFTKPKCPIGLFVILWKLKGTFCNQKNGDVETERFPDGRHMFLTSFVKPDFSIAGKEVQQSKKYSPWSFVKQLLNSWWQKPARFHFFN